ncbi:MAG: lipocalin family protein [Bacteroidetes bacterium]|nr:lipocalin family protein [Bacteroidota bacterium]
MLRKLAYSILLAISGCASTNAPLAVVGSVDLNRYVGTWYEIARFPHRFEKDLQCVSATYTLREDGRVTVLNKGRSIKDNSLRTAEVVAWTPDPKTSAKLKVQFFWPFSGNYWILDLDNEYQQVLIGEPGREYLWILARSKTLDEEVYLRLVQKASSMGFDTSKLERVSQSCD